MKSLLIFDTFEKIDDLVLFALKIDENNFKVHMIYLFTL